MNKKVWYWKEIGQTDSYDPRVYKTVKYDSGYSASRDKHWRAAGFEALLVSEDNDGICVCLTDTGEFVNTTKFNVQGI